jgi:hypothetical protein
MATTLTTTDLIDQFLKQAEKAPPPTRKRLIFAIDATASRQPSWDMAAQVQASMFEAAARFGGISIQLVYHRGYKEMKATGWFASAGLWSEP